MATDSWSEYQANVEPYVEMMSRFLDHDMTTTAFNAAYQQRYLADETLWPDPLFDVLDAVFATADSVVEDSVIRPRIAFGKSPEELRDRVVLAIAQLRVLVGKTDSESDED